jgi:hypothetical protein
MRIKAVDNKAGIAISRIAEGEFASYTVGEVGKGNEN